MGSLGLTAASEVPHALDQCNKRLRLSNGFWQKSYRLPEGSRTLSLRVGMKQGHGGPGENPLEIHALAEARFRGGNPPAQITRCNLGSGVRTTYGQEKC